MFRRGGVILFIALFVALVVPSGAGAGGRWPHGSAVVTPAAPVTFVTTSTSPPRVQNDPQAMLDAAVARIPAGVWSYLTAHGWSIHVADPRRGYVAGTWRYRKVSAVFVRPTMSYADVLGSVGHEVGHMVDFECFTDADRDAILAARGATGRGWWPTGSGDDRRWGVGDWGETFALTITGRWDGLWANPGVATANALVAAHGCSA